MIELDIPILTKSYELYKMLHAYRNAVPKADRFSIYERSETVLIEIIESLLEAGYLKGNKVACLERASTKLNVLRLFVRLMKETRVFDLKKYTALQTVIDEIGRMLGGWIRSMVFSAKEKAS